ncbi:hypothetical protein [Psychrobium sp. 1_MG-2023]|uniref:hypothetical protein n=1 Tax=Psychrobium sp. 1_MG-2023 TaxID=3062624 RepID=UPI001291F0B9|nr:hypothetical protein [Psychrobium sp. 1_MG-2023]MDP2561728.1 hypothetical protein [Psychrobium sp. 1_MG-2023]
MIANVLTVTALTFLVIPVLDWALLSTSIIEMVNYGRYHMLIVQIICITSAVICLLIKRSITQAASPDIQGSSVPA